VDSRTIRAAAAAASVLAGPGALAWPAGGAAAEPVALAVHAAPTFLENVAVLEDGTILYTDYTARAVRAVRPGEATRVFAEIGAHAVSVLPVAEGILVAAHGTPFTDGPSFLGTGLFVVLDRAGREVRRFPAPSVGFVNGIAALPDGTVLAADSAAGSILRVDVGAGAVETWFADPLLAPAPPPAFRPGANGLKPDGRGGVLVSSSARRAVYRIAVGPDGRPRGGPVPVAEDLPGADDFAVLADGGLVVATHGDRVVRTAPDGTWTTLTDDRRVLGSTAVAVFGAGPDRRAVVLGTGGFSDGAGEDAVVLSVPLP